MYLTVSNDWSGAVQFQNLIRVVSKPTLKRRWQTTVSVNRKSKPQKTMVIDRDEPTEHVYDLKRHCEDLEITLDGCLIPTPWCRLTPTYTRSDDAEVARIHGPV